MTSRNVCVAGVVLALLLVSATGAFAQGLDPGWCFFGIGPGCHTGGGGSSPAPAPLLAAGIPAFMALGGGVLVARLRRRSKTRSSTPES
jgi:hypothetical protein